MGLIDFNRHFGMSLLVTIQGFNPGGKVENPKIWNLVNTLKSVQPYEKAWLNLRKKL